MVRRKWRSKRQEAYAEYLKTEHWAGLREMALVRDGRKCVRCPNERMLQVHHKVYRGRPEDSLVEDLETLCRKCHRLEHGFGPNELEMVARKIERSICMEEPVEKADWIALRDEMTPIEAFDQETMGGFDWQMEVFAGVMFKYVLHRASMKCEGKFVCPTSERGKYWRNKALAVSHSILGRSPTFDHLRKVHEKERNMRVRKNIQFDV